MDNASNAQDFSINIQRPALEGMLALLGDWGVAVPTHSDNLARLKLWRALLSPLTFSERAAWASTPELMKPALHYVPSVSSSDRPRSLDWKGFDPDQTKYDAEKKDFLALAEEESHWLHAGLIPHPTKSSTEWPAVALLHACVQAGVTPPTVAELAARIVPMKAPFILEALLPLMSAADWQDALSRHLYGQEQNPPLLHYLFDTPELALKLRSQLAPETINLSSKDGSTLLFRFSIPVRDLPGWIQAGLDATVRDEKGKFPEERNAFRPRSETMEYARVLNAHRSPEDVRLSQWRLAAASLEYDLGADPTTLIDEHLLDCLAAPPPGASLVDYLRTSLRAEEAAQSIQSLYRWMTRRLEPSGRLATWASHPGQDGQLLGYMFLISQQDGAKISPHDILGLAGRLGHSPSDMVLNIVKAATVHDVSLVSPSLDRSRRERDHVQLLDDLLRHEQLPNAVDWLEWLPHMETAVKSLVHRRASDCAAVVNMMTHVFNRLPASAWSAPHFSGLLIAVGVANSLADWPNQDPEHIGALPVADRSHVIAQVDRLLETPFAGQWWSEQSDGLTRALERNAPELLSRFKLSRLSELAAPDATRPAVGGLRM